MLADFIQQCAGGMKINLTGDIAEIGDHEPFCGDT
jgi:hypothetical protein